MRTQPSSGSDAAAASIRQFCPKTYSTSHGEKPPGLKPCHRPHCIGETDEYELCDKLGVDKVAWSFPGDGSEKFDPNDSQGLGPWGVPSHKVRSGLATYQEYGAGPLVGMTPAGFWLMPWNRKVKRS